MLLLEYVPQQWGNYANTSTENTLKQGGSTQHSNRKVFDSWHHTCVIHANWLHYICAAYVQAY